MQPKQSDSKFYDEERNEIVSEMSQPRYNPNAIRGGAEWHNVFNNYELPVLWNPTSLLNRTSPSVTHTAFHGRSQEEL